MHIVLFVNYYPLSWPHEVLMSWFWTFFVSRRAFTSVFGVADFVRWVRCFDTFPFRMAQTGTFASLV
jgi:hypothetical protein